MLPLQFQLSSLFVEVMHPIPAYVFYLAFSSLFYLISFNRVFYKAAPTQDVTNPVSLSSFYYRKLSLFLLALSNKASFFTLSV
jgi:hypothetical protein